MPPPSRCSHIMTDRIQWRHPSRKSRDTMAAPRSAPRPAPRPAPRSASRPAAPAAAPIVLHEHSGGITLLTLNRPDARNCLSEAMLSALGEAFVAIARDAKVRAVVVAANGPVFCAGHDLKELTAHRNDPDRGRAFF